MKMPSHKYALRHIASDNLLGFVTRSNDGQDFCGDVSYELVSYNDNIWYAKTPEHAEWVRNNSTEWYNAGYDTPQHSYRPEELVVEEHITTIHPLSVIELPTFSEMMLWKDKKFNENGHAFFIDNPNYSQKYSLYDLVEYLLDKENKQ